MARFNFSVSYRPGSRNVKPDALPRQFVVDEDQAQGPETILPLRGSLAYLGRGGEGSGRHIHSARTQFVPGQLTLRSGEPEG